MARIDNLTNFLTDVAGAIKTKLGDQTNIPASEFDNKIASIPTQGTYQSKSLEITQNNSTNQITPDTGYDALSSVEVEVNVDAVMTNSDYNTALDLANDILG